VRCGAGQRAEGEQHRSHQHPSFHPLARPLAAPTHPTRAPQGLATGVVAESELRGLLIALVFHQAFEGVALGSRLVDAGMPGWHEVVLSAVFSLAAPLGLAVGVGVTSSLNVSGETYLLVQGTLDGVCAGILLYLGFTLLAVDFPADMKRYCTGARAGAGWQGGMFLALWLGAGGMAFIGKYL
jgi:solute carrier family 39 (zinc transporter), member 1/2/3